MRRAWPALACAAALAACGDDSRARAHAADVASFDQVWTTVRDRHFDPTFGGVDWDGVRRELRPRVLAARNRGEARAVMREMIGRLKLSHFAIVETTDDHGRAPEGDGTFGTVGFDVRTLGGEVIVTSIDAGGPAELAGVRLGWRLDAIDGKPVSELLTLARQAHAGLPSLGAAERGAIVGGLLGSTRQPVALTFEDGLGHVVVKQVTREDVTENITQVGHLVDLVSYEAGRLGEGLDVGYIRVGAFLDPAKVMTRYRRDLTKLGQMRGLIIDLRGNAGGLGPMAGGMLGALVQHEVVLGTSRSRSGTSRTIANPQPGAYDGPLVVLIDELSISTSEIFAAAIQETGRGRLIGRRTAGEVVFSAVEKLPNGDQFQYGVSSYVTNQGRILEGQGVQPDETIALERSELLAGRDVPLEAALAWIDEQRTVTEETSP